MAGKDINTNAIMCVCVCWGCRVSVCEGYTGVTGRAIWRFYHRQMRCQLSFCQHPPLLLFSPGSAFSDGDISWIHWLIRTVILLSLASILNWPACQHFFWAHESFQIRVRSEPSGRTELGKHNVPSPGSWVWFEAIPSSGQASSKIQLSMFQAGWANWRSLPWAFRGPRGVADSLRGKCLCKHYQTLVISAQNTWEEEYSWFQRLWWLREHLWLWFDLHILVGYKTFMCFMLSQKTNSFWVILRLSAF